MRERERERERGERETDRQTEGWREDEVVLVAVVGTVVR